jgi:hypothetical protein
LRRRTFNITVGRADQANAPGLVTSNKNKQGEAPMTKEKFDMKAVYSIVLLATAFVLLMSSVPLYASSMDERIESSARESYIFKQYLNDDSIRVASKDGVVTLTGSVRRAP